MRSYSEFIDRKKREYGDKFDPSDLAPKFVRYFENGQRVKVNTCAMEMTGTIGVTTGWKPCFLLMRTARSSGSPWTLGEKDALLGVKRGKKYLAE